MKDPFDFFELLLPLHHLDFENIRLWLLLLASFGGFILGAVIAYQLNVGFVPIRKKGKLPFTTVEETFELEYGSATVELHTDAVKSGERVLLIDDLIATGGTMMAGMKLLEKLGAQVIEGAAIVDLPELGGSDKLRAAGLPLFTLIDFDGRSSLAQRSLQIPVLGDAERRGVPIRIGYLRVFEVHGRCRVAPP